MITIELKDEGVLAALSRLHAGLGDLSPVMNDIGDHLAESAMKRIADGVTPEGAAFAPRSSVTLARYQARGRPFGGILQYSGEMRRSIFHTYGPDRTEVGSNSIQSAVMQFGAGQGAFGATRRGGPIPWGPIPARPFLGVSDEDRTAVTAIVEEWIEGIAAAG